jgi:NADH-quinone oxidoreductase subunit C/D
MPKKRLESMLLGMPHYFLAHSVGEDRAVFEVPSESTFELISKLKSEIGFCYLLDITSVDYLEFKSNSTQTRFGLVYVLRHENWRYTAEIKCAIAQPETGIKSIVSLFKSANWLEREVWDQYGIMFQNHPNLRRLLNHFQFSGHPLRRDYPITEGQLCTQTDDLMEEMSLRLQEKGLLRQGEMCHSENTENQYMFLNLGPSHPASHGTIRTLCALDGETIVSAVSEIGYLHRGFEKSCENHTYNQIIPYTDRLNYCSALMNNIAFSKTVEEMLDITIPDRAIFIRVILSELSRIIDHLVCNAANLVDMGALTNFFYLFAPREEVYDLLSKLTGARLTNSYTRIGGLAHDVYDGFLDDLSSVIRSIEKGVGDTLALIEHNRIFHDRTQNISPVSAKDAINRGFSGPNLRACGVPCDLRITQPYYYYDTFDFDIALGSTGDVYDRVMVRFEEIFQSLSIIRQAVKRLPEGDVCVKHHAVSYPKKPLVYTTIEGVMNQFKLVYEGVKVPAQEYYGAYEAANGELGFYIVSDGSGTPYKVKVRPPSLLMMASLPDMLEGCMVADAVLVLGSINIIAGELDR